MRKLSVAMDFSFFLRTDVISFAGRAVARSCKRFAGLVLSGPCICTERPLALLICTVVSKGGREDQLSLLGHDEGREGKFAQHVHKTSGSAGIEERVWEPRVPVWLAPNHIYGKLEQGHAGTLRQDVPQFT